MARVTFLHETYLSEKQHAPGSTLNTDDMTAAQLIWRGLASLTKGETLAPEAKAQMERWGQPMTAPRVRIRMKADNTLVDFMHVPAGAVHAAYDAQAGALVGGGYAELMPGERLGMDGENKRIEADKNRVKTPEEMIDPAVRDYIRSNIGAAKASA
jgi:hypothetical protein